MVLISGAICSSEVTAENEERIFASKACILKHLKSKGVLAADFPFNEQLATCTDSTEEMQNFHVRMIAEVTHLMKHVETCVINEFTARTKTIERMLAIMFVTEGSALAETEQDRHLVSVRSGLEQDLKEIGTKCGTETDGFNNFFQRLLGKKKNIKDSEM